MPQLAESVLVPLALFYLLLLQFGVWAGIGAAAGWSYVAIFRRVVQGQAVPGMLMLGALGLTLRTVLSIVSGSVFLYFLQGNVSEIAVASAFLCSACIGRPLAERLAQDFWPLPAAWRGRPAIRRVFVRITLLWGVMGLVKAAVTIWLLLVTSVAVYVAARTLVSMSGTAMAIALSVLWFSRALSAEPGPLDAGQRPARHGHVASDATLPSAISAV
jgi:hypothetical protein